MIASGITGASPVGSPSSVSDELALSEHHIYGSSRLGVHYYDQAVNTWKNKWVYNNPDQSFWNLNAPNAWYSYSYGDLVRKDQRVAWNNWHDPANNSSNNNGYGGAAYFVTNRILGMTQYELTDHLGNVLATVLDRKLGHVSSSNTSLYDYYRADIMSAQDYYPGGMQMPGRSLNSDKSRFGFNGQMKDNEIAGIGNFNTALFWEYDTRLERRWNLDPVDQINKSNYSVLEGNPIRNNDPNGDQSSDIRSRLNDRRFLKGEITEEKWEKFYRDNGYAGAIAGAVLLTVYTGGRAYPLLQNLTFWAIANRATITSVTLFVSRYGNDIANFVYVH